MSPAQHDDRALWRDGATIVILALAPAIGIGIARFAYSLVLPDMRASLDWSYAAAGFMNTVNAVGYLVGALAAASVIKRIGQFGSIFYGSLTCVIALALSAASGNFLLLSLARLAAGIGGAIAFVAGGVAAARLSQNHRNHAALLLSLYYIGPGIGIVLSGIAAPLVLAALGPGSWWIVWGALAAITALLCLALASVRADNDAGNPVKKQMRAALKPMALVLASYCVYSVATIAYMTFMIAWLAEAGAGALTQSVFWILLGLGGVASPFLWSWTIVSTRGGRAMAMLTTFTFVAVMIGLFANARAAVSVCVCFRVGVARGRLGEHRVRATQLSSHCVAERCRRDDGGIRAWSGDRTDPQWRNYRCDRRPINWPAVLGRVSGGWRAFGSLPARPRAWRVSTLG